jgi:hypothetical protein
LRIPRQAVPVFRSPASMTILVTIALGVMTYIAYKLRLARRPTGPAGGDSGPRFFVVHEPPPAALPVAEDHVA